VGPPAAGPRPDNVENPHPFLLINPQNIRRICPQSGNETGRRHSAVIFRVTCASRAVGREHPLRSPRSLSSLRHARPITKAVSGVASTLRKAFRQAATFIQPEDTASRHPQPDPADIPTSSETITARPALCTSFTINPTAHAVTAERKPSPCRNLGSSDWFLNPQKRLPQARCLQLVL